MAEVEKEADWLAWLRAACERDTQREVAERLKVSPAMVNQALKGTYRGNLAQLENRVRGELMNEKVGCPVLWEISKARCEEEQRRPFRMSSHLTVKLFVTCPTCPRRTVK